jgi:hypothetical protein
MNAKSKANTVPIAHERERAGEHILFCARIRSRIARKRGDALGDLAHRDVDRVGRYPAPRRSTVAPVNRCTLSCSPRAGGRQAGAVFGPPSSATFEPRLGGARFIAASAIQIAGTGQVPLMTDDGDDELALS